MIPQSLEIRHEEEPVPAIEEFGNDDRTAQLKSILVAAKRVLLTSRLEPLARIQRRVAKELKAGAVKFIAARFGRHVNLTGLVAVLGRIDASLYLELPQGIEFQFGSVFSIPSSV